MIRTRKRQILCAGLITLNLAFIWINSLLPREISAAFSRLVGAILERFIAESGELSEGEGHGTLRKIAHFTEFCSLGFLMGWMAWMICSKKWKCYVLPLVCGAAAACIDETIQILVPGRGPHIRDVGIDTLGVLLGIGIIAQVAHFAIKKQKLTGSA